MKTPNHPIISTLIVLLLSLLLSSFFFITNAQTQTDQAPYQPEKSPTPDSQDTLIPAPQTISPENPNGDIKLGDDKRPDKIDWKLPVKKFPYLEFDKKKNFRNFLNLSKTRPIV